MPSTTAVAYNFPYPQLPLRTPSTFLTAITSLTTPNMPFPPPLSGRIVTSLLQLHSLSQNFILHTFEQAMSDHSVSHIHHLQKNPLNFTTANTPNHIHAPPPRSPSLPTYTTNPPMFCRQVRAPLLSYTNAAMAFIIICNTIVLSTAYLPNWNNPST